MLSRRLRGRLVRHHLPIASAAIVTGWALYVTRPFPDVLTRLSFATAYPALVLLAISLAIGPLRILAGRQPVMSLDLRRDFGIWAGITGVFHAVIGQFVHLRGRPWLYYIYEDWRARLLPVRHDLFGFANYSGLVSVLVLAVLLLTSNDLSLRRLGGTEWKGLQRWNYVCFGLAALHGLLYQLGIESQKLPFVLLAIGCIAVTTVLQWAGWRQRRLQRTTSSRAVAGGGA